MSTPNLLVTNRRAAARPTIPEDGYQWKKYGQKYLISIRRIRSYFRCKNSRSCMAKKRVEWPPTDPTTLRITYHGQHDHHHPPSDHLPNLGAPNHLQYELSHQAFGQSSSN